MLPIAIETKFEIFRESFDFHIFSYSESIANKTFRSCSFNTATFNYAILENCAFIDCCLDNIDGAEAVFRNCRFENTSMNGANLQETQFFGCHFLYSRENSVTLENHSTTESPFARASFMGAKFRPYAKIQTRFSNCTIKHSGFRYVEFLSVEFKQSTFFTSSLEYAVFDQCSVDEIDLRDCACRGVTLNRNTLGSVAITFEQLLTIIGLENIAVARSLTISLVNEDRTTFDVSSIAETTVHRNVKQALSETYIPNASVFEAINGTIFCTLREVGFDSALLSERQAFHEKLRCAAGDAMGNGAEKRRFQFRNLELAFRLLLHHKIFDRELHARMKKFLSLGINAGFAPNQLTFANLKLNCEAVEENIMSDICVVTLTNHTASFNDLEALTGLIRFVDWLGVESGLKDLKIENVTSSSINVNISLPSSRVAALLAVLSCASLSMNIEIKFDVNDFLSSLNQTSQKNSPNMDIVPPREMTMYLERYEVSVNTHLLPVPDLRRLSIGEGTDLPLALPRPN